MSQTPRILIADEDGPWRTSLLAELAAEQASLQATDDGKVLLEALTHETGPRVVLIGQRLTGVGGLDALYQAKKAPNRAEPGRRRQTVLLISEVRSDLELLELLRKRGIDGFIYREVPVEETAGRILTSLYSEQRAEPRAPIKLPATIRVGESELGATLEDLSAGGACVVVPLKKLSKTPSQSDVIDLHFQFSERKIACKGEVRRLEVRRGLFGDRLVMGIKFVDPDFDTRKALEETVHELHQDREPLPWPGARQPTDRGF